MERSLPFSVVRGSIFESEVQSNEKQSGKALNFRGGISPIIPTCHQEKRIIDAIVKTPF
jgi:hypothetical protein